MTRRQLTVAQFVAAVVTLACYVAGLASAPTADLPQQLNSRDFWKLSEELSEPNGTFRSDNLLSNEIWLQHVIPELTKTAKTGRVYLGVGPEQNFTYIAALKPAMVFIVDVRRGNLQLHLMYKALFEMSNDRAEFVSKLFAKKRPAGLSATSTALEIFNAYSEVPTSEALFKETLQSMRDHLVKTRNLPLTKEDLDGIEYVANAFYWYGPGINYNSSGGRMGRMMATYFDLMVATDAEGRSRSYLASEENFKVMKDLHSKNLLVPVVGNFGGPKALRAVGTWVKERGGTVTAFYLSNVEQYPRPAGAVARLLQQRGGAAARRHQRFHPLSASRPELERLRPIRDGAHQPAREDGGRNQGLPEVTPATSRDDLFQTLERRCAPITRRSAPPPLAGKTVAAHTLSIPRRLRMDFSDGLQALRSAWLVRSFADHTERSRPRGIAAPVFRLRTASASSKAPSTE